MNRTNEFPRVLDGRIGMDSVTEIKNMPLPLPEFFENVFDLLANAAGRRIQYRGIKIPLERDPIPDKLPGTSDIRGPVEADDLASRAREGIDRMSAIFTKHNNWRSPRPDPADGLPDVPEGKFAEGVPREDSPPRVKDLNCLSPCFYLGVEIGADGGGKFPEQGVSQRRTTVQNFFDKTKRSRAAALDHITR